MITARLVVVGKAVWIFSVGRIIYKLKRPFTRSRLLPSPVVRCRTTKICAANTRAFISPRVLTAIHAPRSPFPFGFRRHPLTLHTRRHPCRGIFASPPMRSRNSMAFCRFVSASASLMNFGTHSLFACGGRSARWIKTVGITFGSTKISGVFDLQSETEVLTLLRVHPC